MWLHVRTFSRVTVSDLGDIFYTSKDKTVADDLLKYLETLAPGAVEAAAAETARIEELSEEEYAKEFPHAGVDG